MKHEATSLGYTGHRYHEFLPAGKLLGIHSLYLLASDAGYGFVARLGDMAARTKAGKSLLSVPKNAEVLP
ncbi:hypothetical protein ACFL3A_01505, partial [Pseudomonadota bacterium]